MPLRTIRVAALLSTASVATTLACQSTITFVAAPADASDDASSTADAADNEAAPLDAGTYVPDLGAQSANYQINAAHTGGTNDPSLFGEAHRRWEKEFSGPLSFPLIARQKVIVTWMTNEKHGALQAFDVTSGASVWGPIDLGESTASSSVYDGGRVFALNRSGTLKAFDVETGTPLWTTELGDPATPIQFLSASTAYLGKVYVLPNNFGKAMAVDEVTGTIAWKAAQWGGIASPAVTDTAVLLGLGCKHVYRLDPTTGAVAWHTTSNCAGTVGTPVVVADTLYHWSGGGVSMLDITTGVWSTSGYGGTAPPAIQAGLAFFPFNDLVMGLSLHDRSVSWKYRPDPSTWFVRTSPLIAGGNVLVLWDDCTLRAFAPKTGALQWSDSEPSACTSGPSVSPFGGPVAMAAAAGVIAVPFRTHLVIYGVDPASDGGVDASSD